MTILILHGIMGYAGENWGQWLHDQLVAKGHTVIMPTLPKAERPDRAEWLRTVEDLLKDVDHDQLIIVAHSLGVVTAQDYAEGHEFRGLVSVSGFASPYGHPMNEYFVAKHWIDPHMVRANIKKIAIFYGDNDPHVSREALAELPREFGVRPTIIHGGGHLNAAAGFTEFPALLAAVEKMA
jgi:predicted alpha/beta hydrolase family esterase